MTNCQIVDMHKQIVQLGLLITLLVGLFWLGFFPDKSGAITAPDLVNAVQLEVQKGPDVPSSPTSMNGNIDCIKDDPYDCVIDTAYGKFVSGGIVKRNKTDSYIQIINYIENKPRNLVVPNSTSIISYTTEPPYGFYLYFTKNFASSVTTVPIPGTNSYQYKINRLYDGRLLDKSGKRLAADYASMSYSSNGQWMVVSMPNVAMLRVNLETFEVVPFGNGFNYTIGLDPAIKTAITNDGRYVAVSSKTFGRFDVYDLDTCSSVPNVINGPVSCQKRNLQSMMQQQVPGYTSISQIRFINSNTLRIYASYNLGAGNKIASFIISPYGLGIHKHDYLVLGDSYISGQGAYSYLEGTDTKNNECHVSLFSYPYLLAYSLNYNSFHSVACSGAKMNDITNTSKLYEGQTKAKTKRGDYTNQEINSIITNFQQGYINQLEFVTTYQPQVITVSIGGNDVGFSNILASCVSPLNFETCYNTYEDRLELVRHINAQFLRLVNTYQTIKNSSPSDIRIYAIGYPQIVKPGGNCGLNVQLNADEVNFAKQFTEYSNTIIQQAASRAGVLYVDTQNAFNGHRLCEAKPGKFAVNGLTKGKDFPKLLGGFIHGPFANESYHPTPLGYSLLKDSVASATNGLSTLMPEPNLAAGPPVENGLDILNVAHSGRAIKIASLEDSFSGDILPRGASSEIFVDGLQNSLKPSSSYSLELHSDPVVLGNLTSNISGDLSGQITIPVNTAPGFHSLHIYGTNVANEPIDIYKTVYMAANGEDYNGNGVPNSNDPCVFVDASGQDYDQDGVDDTCDGVIDEAPSVPAAPAIPPASGGVGSGNNNPSQTPNNNDPTSSPANDTLKEIFTNPSLNPVVTSQTSPSPTITASSNNTVLTVENNDVTPEIQKEPIDQPRPAVLAAQTTKSGRNDLGLIGALVITLGTLGLMFGLRKK